MFHLGSNAKAITAAMLARPIEAGKLSWTTTSLSKIEREVLPRNAA
jgi:hypothetical protein